MRGSLTPDPYAFVILGIIPAHAGLTDKLTHVIKTARDHPRACGAHVLTV